MIGKFLHNPLKMIGFYLQFGIIFYPSDLLFHKLSSFPDYLISSVQQEAIAFLYDIALKCEKAQ